MYIYTYTYTYIYIYTCLESRAAVQSSSTYCVVCGHCRTAPDIQGSASCSPPSRSGLVIQCDAMCCIVMQCAKVCCSVLKCVAATHNRPPQQQKQQCLNGFWTLYHDGFFFLKIRRGGSLNVEV